MLTNESLFSVTCVSPPSPIPSPLPLRGPEFCKFVSRVSGVVLQAATYQYARPVPAPLPCQHREFCGAGGKAGARQTRVSLDSRVCEHRVTSAKLSEAALSRIKFRKKIAVIRSVGVKSMT